MHILILNYEYPPLGGGAGNATYYLLRELARCHSEASVEESRDSSQAQDDLCITLVTSSTDKYHEEQLAPNIKIYYLDIGKKGKNLHFQNNKDLLVFSWKVYNFCKKLQRAQNFDLIHAFFGIPCGYIAMKLGLPYIVSLRGSDVPFYNERFYWLDKLFFQRMSLKIWEKSFCVTANSEGLKQLALKSAPDQQISVIYNGVDVEKFAPNSGKKCEFTVISTSRLIQRKGINYLIEAFIKFNKKYPNSKLLIAGSGNLEAKLKQIVKANNLSSKVCFLGVVDANVITSFYQQADVFVLPSLNEGMSNSVLEAMSCGLALIVTDVGGTKELVSKDNGVIIKKENSNDIFNALEKLYIDRRLLSKMKLASRAKSETMRWQDMANQYLSIYKLML